MVAIIVVMLLVIIVVIILESKRPVCERVCVREWSLNGSR